MPTTNDGLVPPDLITPLISVAAFVLLVVLLAGMRIRSEGRFAIETREIIAAVVAVGLGLFVFGEITEIAFGDVRFVRQVREAAATPVKDRALQFIEAEVPFKEEEVAAKAGPSLIPSLIENKTSALSFRLGSGVYVGSVIATYLAELTQAQYLRYLVFNDLGSRLVGVADARAIAALFKAGDQSLSSDRLAEWINNSDLKSLRRLPGYMDATESLSSKTTTRDALSMMLERNVEQIPVIDEAGRFQGIAYRAQLMGTILMALAAAGAE